MFAASIFNDLRDMSFQTGILEICNWDESEKDKCMEAICLVFEELSSSKSDFKKESPRDLVRKKLSNAGLTLGVVDSVCEYLAVWIKTKRYSLEKEYEA